MLANKLAKYTSVDIVTGCWNWTGCLSHGYGHVRWDGKMRLATRAMAVSSKMKDPKDEVFTFESSYLILHRCNNPTCINPDHLYIGTYSDNMYDRARSGRAPDLRGVKHPQCKLTEQDVDSIRQLLKQKIPQRKIAKQFGISQSQICLINTGKSWRK